MIVPTEIVRKHASALLAEWVAIIRGKGGDQKKNKPSDKAILMRCKNVEPKGGKTVVWRETYDLAGDRCRHLHVSTHWAWACCH
jgi:hypothetical protein